MQHISLSKLTTEQRNILVTAEKKRICEQRALHIVEMLLEPTIESAWLLQQVKFIDQNHYQDVTEERCVTGCCGYPLCSRSLGKIPKKQFQISTLTNRVYDISERKKFCSNACFRASRHLHAQIQTSPLWLRDHEPAPSFTLLDEAANRRGVAGDPVDLGVVCAPAEDAAQTTTDQVVTGMLHQFDELSERIGELGLRPEEESERQPGGSRAGRGKVRFGTPAGRTDDPPPPAPAEVAPADQEPGESGVAESPADGQTAEASPTRAPPETSAGAPPRAQEPASPDSESESGRTAAFKRPSCAARRPQHPLVVVEARLFDWMAARTVPEPPAPPAPSSTAHPELGQSVPPCAEATHTVAETCARDDSAGGGPSEVAAPILTRQEAEARNQALLAYLQGQTGAPRKEAVQQPAQGQSPYEPPLIESQDRVRRRLVNDHLGRAMARLLPPLGLVWTDVTSPLRQLIAGFHLTAQNVTLGPHQWTLAALVLLRYLLRRRPELDALARDADGAFASALRPFQLTRTRLDKLVSRLEAAVAVPVPCDSAR